MVKKALPIGIENTGDVAGDAENREAWKTFLHLYWSNISSNDIVKDMIARAGRETKGQIEIIDS